MVLQVSPADGHVAHFGAITGHSVEQVKGAVYDMRAFLAGVPTPRPGNGLFHVVIYLAPGDYHRFHSPANWSMKQYIHFPGEHEGSGMAVNGSFVAVLTCLARFAFFYRDIIAPGELLSVRPGVMQMVQGLFVFNERIVLKGEWQHGFFSMTAIGATNVGSISINIPDQVRHVQTASLQDFPGRTRPDNVAAAARVCVPTSPLSH